MLRGDAILIDEQKRSKSRTKGRELLGLVVAEMKVVGDATLRTS
jgi:hypothetical protein